MKVLFVSYEVAPLFKFGGLGDVAGSLPKSLHQLGIDIRVGMPLYKTLHKTDYLPDSRVPMVFAESSLFKTEGIIGNNKNPRNRVVAFVHFSEKLLETVKKLSFRPDIIHINEWHGGLIPWLIHFRKDPFFVDTRTLVTIHNSLYQGIFLVKHILDNPKTRSIGKAIQEPKNDFVNITEISLVHADWINTVSPAFAEEILQGRFDFGLKKIIYPKKDRFYGILNGLDTSIWNPSLDVYIPMRYNRHSAHKGKIRNKSVFQKKVGLAVGEKLPLFSFNARLVWQKGIDLVLTVLPHLVKLPLQLVISGTGDRDIVSTMNSISKKFPGKIAIISKYKEETAHELFAASDFFLMPSIFEPCGLTQLMSMAYGTIPIVNPVGGLTDTVKDNVTGLYIKQYTSKGLLESIRKALLLWNHQESLLNMRQAAMGQDFSWKKSAKKYNDLYRKMLSLN